MGQLQKNDANHVVRKTKKKKRGEEGRDRAPTGVFGGKKKKKKSRTQHPSEGTLRLLDRESKMKDVRKRGAPEKSSATLVR